MSSLDESYYNSPPLSSQLESPPPPFSSGSLFVDTGMGFEPFSKLSPSSPTLDLKPISVGEVTPFGGEAESIVTPRPLECLQNIPIPPFLSKTFDLVDDRVLDPIISWGPAGESFVVWDPLELARLVLPRNFKHNNFSSFVRQLNTYGFHKIDTDRWEFANEAFRRGKKHLLKTIQRRKAPQSQHVGSYVGLSTEMKVEVERLRKERCKLMQEVVELQQQNHGTVNHMEVVNQRLQAAELRQKQMVSFLAKLLQNPAVLARLKRKKEIGSSRMRRKFVKQREMAKPDSSEGQIVRSEWINLAVASAVGGPNQFPIEQAPDHLLEGMPGNLDLDMDSVACLYENVTSADLWAAEQMGEQESSKGAEESPEFPSPGVGRISSQEDIWSMGFDVSTGMSSSVNELWDNAINYDVPELGVTEGLSDFWDLASPQVAGGSGTEDWHWQAGEPHLCELESDAGQPKDYLSKNP